MTWPTKDDFVDGDVLTAAQVNNIANNLNEFDPTSATSGEVWVADGAGSGAYALAGGGMTLISSGSLAGLTTLNLTSIPQTYEHLQLRVYDVYFATTGRYISFKPNGTAATSARVGFYRDSTVGTSTFNSEAGQSASGLTPTIYVSNQNYNRAQFVIDILYYTHAEPTTPGDEQKLVKTTFKASDSAGSSQRLGFYITNPQIDVAITSIEIAGTVAITAGEYELWGIK